jgi:hypothetical protein
MQPQMLAAVASMFPTPISFSYIMVLLDFWDIDHGS